MLKDKWKTMKKKMLVKIISEVPAMRKYEWSKWCLNFRSDGSCLVLSVTFTSINQVGNKLNLSFSFLYLDQGLYRFRGCPLTGAGQLQENDHLASSL